MRMRKAAIYARVSKDLPEGGNFHFYLFAGNSCAEFKYDNMSPHCQRALNAHRMK